MTKEEIMIATVAAEKLCDAVGAVQRARDEFQRRLADTRPGDPLELLALGFTRMCSHLAEAAQDMPTEAWRAYEEIRSATQGEASVRANMLFGKEDA